MCGFACKRIFWFYLFSYQCSFPFISLQQKFDLLRRLEKEYTRIRHKEAEDNEEIRRLKTENRLLIQRVDDLEKVRTCY